MPFAVIHLDFKACVIYITKLHTQQLDGFQKVKARSFATRIAIVIHRPWLRLLEIQ